MFGGRIKQARKRSNLTLDALAARVGVTKGYLSQIENDKIEPSLSVLRKLAACLDVPAVQLMYEDANGKPILVRKGSIKMTLADQGISYDIISPRRNERGGARFVEARCVLAPGVRIDNKVLDKDCEQLVFVRRGTLTYTIGDVSYSLGAESSIYVANNTGHHIVNNTEQEVEVLWVIRPINQ